MMMKCRLCLALRKSLRRRRRKLLMRLPIKIREGNTTRINRSRLRAKRRRAGYCKQVIMLNAANRGQTQRSWWRGYRRMKRGSWNASEIGGQAALSVSPRVESRWRKLLDAFPMESWRDESIKKLWADRKVRVRGRRGGMDITWVTDRIAVGGGIWNPDNMAGVSPAGITPILDMQIQVPATPPAGPHGVIVIWN